MQEVRAKPGNESTPNKKEMNQSQLKLSEVGPTQMKLKSYDLKKYVDKQVNMSINTIE